MDVTYNITGTRQLFEVHWAYLYRTMYQLKIRESPCGLFNTLSRRLSGPKLSKTLLNPLTSRDSVIADHGVYRRLLDSDIPRSEDAGA